MKPTGKHTDWMWPFSMIPRGLTSYEAESVPKKIAGNAKTEHLRELDEWGNESLVLSGPLAMKPYPKPIPVKGEWWIGWPPYIAITTKGGWHIRLGIRFDDVDLYYAWPSVTIKKVKEEGQ